MHIRFFSQKKQKVSKNFFRRLSAFVLSCSLFGNIFGILTIAAAKGKTDYNTMISIIKEKSLNYLETQKNIDGSYGLNALLNDTADAVYMLRSSGLDVSEAKEMATSRITCLDEAAQLVAASADISILDSYMKNQNENGGFGLTADYTSDTYDTALTLFALGETGAKSYSSAIENAANWLIAQQRDDGSYAYTENSDNSITITALSLSALSKLRNIGLLSEISENTLSATAAYLRDEKVQDYSDIGIEDTLLTEIALLRFDKSVNAADIINNIYNAQHVNGSFGTGIHATALACRLLNELEDSSCLLIDDMNTVISTSEAKVGKSVMVNAVTTIQYHAVQDSSLTLKMTVMNGDTRIYENSQKVQLSSNIDSIQLSSGSFVLNEEKDNGITAEISLMNDKTVLKTETIQFSVIEDNKVIASEISSISLNLDRYVSYIDVPADIIATGTILFSTNIDTSVDVFVRLLKDGELLHEENTCANLQTEQDSVSVKLSGFRIDTAKKGIYTFEGICKSGGKEICSDQVNFEVLEKPVDGVSDLQVIWFQPIPDSLSLYSGENRIVCSNAALIYNSDKEYNGTIKISATYGDEILTEATAPIKLEAQNIYSMNSLYELPKYESDKLISFSANKTGIYTVTAELFDTYGNLSATGSREVTVINKPKQDLLLYSEKSENGKTVSLRWNDISTEAESFDYQLLRRITGGAWEKRSIWNENEQINVLNVYPESPYLSTWMTQTISDTELPAGKGIFQIESVHIDTYNQDPEKYMKHEDGRWKYDVIFFGSSDCNSHRDLSESSAEIVQAFIDDGRGVLFGHDTICTNFGHYNFCRFADQLGILVKNDSTVFTTTSVSVTKNGTLTNYPWNIPGTLTVPACHSYGQFVGNMLNGTEWMTLNTTQRIDDETGAHSNFYLVTNNNLGMIQTGHSTGSATDDERKVLANTLFYLYQTTQVTDAKDASFYDVTPPDCPDAEFSLENETMNIKLHSVDNGTTYEYSIVASSTMEESEHESSNIVREEAFSGLNGFVVVVNNSKDPNPELNIRGANGEFEQNILKADANGDLTVSFSPKELGSGSYLHLFAVDNENNVSEERILPITETVNTNLVSNKQVYQVGETVTLRDSTTASPLNFTADALITVYDSFGNKIADIAEEKGVELVANNQHSDEWLWTIPENTIGLLRAVISWTINDEVVTETETIFRVGDEKIENRIISDRRIYSISDPINLTNTIWNRSALLTENELTLSVKVAQVGSIDAASFSHSISSINQNGNLSYSDAIAPLKLDAGDYTAIATVLQNNVIISTSETEFTVEQNAYEFTGTLDFTPNSNLVRTDFMVKNQSNKAAENVEITIIIYSNGSDTPSFTINKLASIPASGNVDFSDTFTLEYGEYSGVLKVRFNGTENDLDYDGFTLYGVTETTIETAKNNETTKTTCTTEMNNLNIQTTSQSQTHVDAPQNGDYRLTILYAGTLFSFAGLIILYVTRKRGEKKEHE